MQVSAINSAADARRLLASEAANQSGQAAAPTKSGQPTPEQIRTVARQFEAIILRQLLTPAIEPMMSHGLGSAGEGKSAGGGGGVYGYLMTDVLASSLSQGRGLGLSQMLEKQFTPKGAAAAAQAAATYRATEVQP